MNTRRLVVFLLFAGLMATPLEAFAGKYIVYLYGRQETAWPPNAYLGHDSTWTDVVPSYNGSARLADATTRAAVRSAVGTHCSGGNSCIISCYSDGCSRTLLALNDLSAAKTPCHRPLVDGGGRVGCRRHAIGRPGD